MNSLHQFNLNSLEINYHVHSPNCFGYCPHMRPALVAHEESTLIVVFNTLRLLAYKKCRKFENAKFFKSKVLKKLKTMN